MAQILSIYGLVAAVMMTGSIKEKMSIHTGFMQLGAGLSVGLCGLASGFAIGIVGDAGGMSLLLHVSAPVCLHVFLTPPRHLVRASSVQPRLYVGMVLILIFAEVLGLYGVVVSVLMISNSTTGVAECKL